MAHETDTAIVNILVVDDSQTDRTLVTGLVSTERPGWTVMAVSAAAEGLKVLASQSVTAVVTDLFMPEMSGEEFLIEIRRRFPSVPVILITSKGDDEIAARSLELGAVNYVPKRRLADDLVPAIDEVLRGMQEAALARDVLSHLIHSRTVFRIDSDLEQIRSLLHLLRERLKSVPSLQDNQVRELTDAVREALMNAYIHGGRISATAALESSTAAVGTSQDPQGSSVIELQFSLNEERVRFTITDQGSGFDTSALEHEQGSQSGSGFRTMRHHMDGIEFNDRGNQIVLTKQLTPPRTN